MTEGSYSHNFQDLDVTESENDDAEAVVGEESEMVIENTEESSSINCSSGFVNLQIVNGVSELEEDCDTIDEDQPDDDASMIVVTHVSFILLTPPMKPELTFYPNNMI